MELRFKMCYLKVDSDTSTLVFVKAINRKVDEASGCSLTNQNSKGMPHVQGPLGKSEHERGTCELTGCGRDSFTH